MKQVFSCVLLLLALLARGAAAAEGSAEGAKLAGQVREIFEAKCRDCHGPDLPRPKGKFGYVLDLKRIAENPEYVTRGAPEKSELYLMVRDDEMPGEDANVPPLTPEEKEAVRRWVELGAPEAGATVSTPAAPAVIAEQKPHLPLWKRALRWIGNFHPVSAHFPVALMFVAAFAEGLAWWTRREAWMQTVRFLVILAALGGVTTASLGWVNAYFQSYTGKLGPVLQWHRWMGTGTALWCVLCAVLVIAHHCPEGSPQRQRFRGALLLGAVLVGISGYLGSLLIYGVDHYVWK